MKREKKKEIRDGERRKRSGGKKGIEGEEASLISSSSLLVVSDLYW